jgi:hypothetical protein
MAFFNTKGGFKAVPTLDKNQQALMKYIKEGLENGTGPFAEIFGKFNAEDFNKGVTQPSLKNFKENILPVISEKFIAGNQVLGSGHRRGQLKAGVDLQSDIDKLMYQAQQDKEKQRLQGLQTALGVKTHENVYQPGEQGWGTSLLTGALTAAGTAIGGAGGGLLANYVSNLFNKQTLPNSGAGLNRGSQSQATPG